MSPTIQSIAEILSLLLSLHATGTRCEQRQAYLKQSTGGDCQTFQVGEPFTSDSPLDCYWECMARYQDTCQSIVYNLETATCTPGSVAFGPVSKLPAAIPDEHSDDLIFYAIQPIPACDTTDGFAIYDVCGTTACLYVSTARATYEEAVANCSQMNSRLYIGNTLVKFSVFWHVSLNYINDFTFLGLTDVAEEGKFVWDNGEPLTAEQGTYVWDNSQPDAHGDEDCVEARHGEGWDPYGLNDIGCWRRDYYICER